MLNFRKRIFLFLTIIAVVLGFAACTDSSNTVRINLDSEEYVVRMQSYADAKATIKAAASVSVNDIEVVYESEDESIVRYEHGVLYPVSEGETEIKVYWKDKDVVFDKATVKVIKPALPVLVGHEGQQFLKGGEGQIAYTLHKNYTEAAVKFESLNPEVATITESGVVSAVKVGTANIHAVVSDYEESEEYYFSIEVVESDFAINYVLQECKEGHMSVGNVETCPVCGKPIVGKYTRVVGFLTKVNNWNPTRRTMDFPNRQFYGSINV